MADLQREPLTLLESAELARLEALVIGDMYETKEAIRRLEERPAIQSLMEIRSRNLYRNYGTWTDYINSKFPALSLRRINQLMAHQENLEDLGFTLSDKVVEPKADLVPISNQVSTIPTPSERQTRPLSGLTPEEKREVWTDAVEISGADPTGAAVQSAAEIHKENKKGDMGSRVPTNPTYTKYLTTIPEDKKLGVWRRAIAMAAEAKVKVTPEHVRDAMREYHVEANRMTPAFANSPSSPISDGEPRRSDALPTMRQQPSSPERLQLEAEAEEEVQESERRSMSAPRSGNDGYHGYIDAVTWSDDFSRRIAYFIGVLPAIPAKDFPERRNRFGLTHKILEGEGWHHRADEVGATIDWLEDVFSKEEFAAIIAVMMTRLHDTEPKPPKPPAQLTIDSVLEGE